VTSVTIPNGSNATINNRSIIDTINTGKSSSLLLYNYGEIKRVNIGEESAALINNSGSIGSINAEKDNQIAIYNKGTINKINTGINSISDIINVGKIGSLNIGSFNKSMLFNKGNIDRLSIQSYSEMMMNGGSYIDEILAGAESSIIEDEATFGLSYENYKSLEEYILSSDEGIDLYIDDLVYNANQKGIQITNLTAKDSKELYEEKFWKSKHKNDKKGTGNSDIVTDSDLYDVIKKFALDNYDGKVDVDTLIKAFQVTGASENNDGFPSFAAVTGNYDGAGLSLGIIQFNFSKGSDLLDMLREMDSNYSNIMENALGAQKYKELKAVIDKNDKGAARTWGNKISDPDSGKLEVKDDWKKALVNLCRTKEFVQIQLNHSKQYIDNAIRISKKYGLDTQRGFIAAFDQSVKDWSPPSVSNKASLTDKQIITKWANSYGKHSDEHTRLMRIVNGNGIVSSYKINDGSWR
jgi:hypothetical protein